MSAALRVLFCSDPMDIRQVAEASAVEEGGLETRLMIRRAP